MIIDHICHQWKSNFSKLREDDIHHVCLYKSMIYGDSKWESWPEVDKNISKSSIIIDKIMGKNQKASNSGLFLPEWTLREYMISIFVDSFLFERVAILYSYNYYFHFWFCRCTPLCFSLASFKDTVHPTFFYESEQRKDARPVGPHNFKGPQGPNDLLSTLVFFEKTKIIVLRYLPI